MSELFHLEEYKALRDEMLELLRQLHALNRFLLVSTAVAVAWLLNEAGNLDGFTSLLGAWMPYFLSIWFGIYRADILRAMATLGEYLKKIEGTYGNESLGWQKAVNHYMQQNDGFGFYRRTRFVNLAVRYAMLIFAAYYSIRYAIGFETIKSFLQKI